MCKCSVFVRLACLAGVVLLGGAVAQEYDIGEPDTGEVTVNRARSADVELIFDEQDIVVNPGDQLNLNCGVQGDMRYCIWETSNNVIYQVEDVYEGLVGGLRKPDNTAGNECGVVIDSATIEHHGSWTCKIFAKGHSLVGTKDVIVTIKPTDPLLEVSSGGDSFEVTTEEEGEVKCSVAAARPAVGIRWYLGDRDITVSAKTEETTSDEGGTYKSVSTLTRLFEPTDNGRILTCSISHQTLGSTRNASIPVSVIFKPIEKELTTFYQIVAGTDYEVRLNFSANPSPTKTEWRYGDSFQNMATTPMNPEANDRYYTPSIEPLGDGSYTATLRISGFSEEDAKQYYMLVVENRIGETRYQVKLSMDEAPIDGDSETRDHDKIPPTEYSVSEGIVFDDEMESKTLGGGAVAGIVIVVLIVVVAVVAAGYARYRQMFCFAPAAAPDPEEGKDIKEEHSDTESARGPNTTHAAQIKNSFGKLTQVFKKPKKDQDTKLEEGLGGEEEKKYLTKEEPKNDTKKGQPGDEKEQTEGKNINETNESQPSNEQKPTEKNNEVVYAELDLSKGESEKKSEVNSEDKTQYAQIIGTVTDNREEEKKE